MNPNVLLIQADQWNARCLSLLGNPNMRTPQLDALARTGSLYRNATAQSPICMPSRVSMLSGQYVSTTKQFGFTSLCDRRTPWLHQTLKRAGYRTGAFGKFHTLCVGSEQWDFDVAAPTMPEDHDLARPVGNHYKAYCDRVGVPWPTDQMHCHNPWGGPRRSSHARAEMSGMEQMSCQSDVPVAHSLETWTTDQCVQFLRAAGDQPFFAWLTYDRPHFPTTLPPEWFATIRPRALQLTPGPTPEQIAALPPSLRSYYAHAHSRQQHGDETFRFIVATYYTLIEWLDAEIGRVLTELKKLGLDETTTIVFTSDHGDEAGYRDLYDKWTCCSSAEVTQVPLIIRPAPCLGQRPGIVEAPVELVDLFPTLCRLSGVEVPVGVEGRDLQTVDADRPVFCEQLTRRAVTQGGWRLTFDQNDAECLLVDLRNDPFSFTNRYSDPAAREPRVRLKRSLLEFLMARLHGPFTPADEEYFKTKLHSTGDPLPPLMPEMDGACPYRAAAVIRRGERLLCVPFWDEPLYLFTSGQAAYRTVRDALPYDPVVAEQLLDEGLRECMRQIHPLALLGF